MIRLIVQTGKRKNFLRSNEDTINTTRFYLPTRIDVTLSINVWQVLYVIYCLYEFHCFLDIALIHCFIDIVLMRFIALFIVELFIKISCTFIGSKDTINITRFYLTLSIDVPLFINVWLALLIVELFIKISCTFIGSEDTINITRFYFTFSIDVPLFIIV